MAPADLSMLGRATIAQEKMRISLQLPITSPLGENLMLFEKKWRLVLAVLSRQGVASLICYVGHAPVVNVLYMLFLFNTKEKVRAVVAQGSAVRDLLES